MLERSRDLMDSMGSDDLFTQASADFITEAWAAAQFAEARKAEAVRLVSSREQWPDFAIRMPSGTVESWEFTEADEPGRRRGDDFRQAARRRAAGVNSLEGISAEQIADEAKDVPAWVRERCKAKVEKHYSGRATLLIYLNWSDFGWHNEIAHTFLDATSPAKDAFTEIWILWKTGIHRTWRDGIADPLVRMAQGAFDA